jgi:hypothetical protein
VHPDFIFYIIFFGTNETSSLPEVKKLHPDLNMDIEVLNNNRHQNVRRSILARVGTTQGPV